MRCNPGFEVNQTNSWKETFILPLRVAIIGAGRMGRIRALSAKAHPECEVVHISDLSGDLAQALAKEAGGSSSTSWQGALERSDVDAVVVATPHKFLAPITVAAVRAGKLVFCEKPMARTTAEAEEILGTLDHLRVGISDSRMVVGYTLRHHPAIARAKELITSGAIGEPFYLRGRYGHGGRSGYEREWRGNRDLAGGGELLDQGIHLIDLSRWFMGEFCQVVGFVNSYFWNSGRPNSSRISPELLVSATAGLQTQDVEDNAFMLMRTSDKKTAMLHASWTQWKNMFSFEIFGPKGFIAMEGLGGSYGEERLVVARRPETDGVPKMEEVRFKQPAEAGNTSKTGTNGKSAVDSSSVVALPASCWDEEWADFVCAARQGHPKRAATVIDGYQNLKIVGALYSSAERCLPTMLDRNGTQAPWENRDLKTVSSGVETDVVRNL